MRVRAGVRAGVRVRRVGVAVWLQAAHVPRGLQRGEEGLAAWVRVRAKARVRVRVRGGEG